jgi:tripartite-type tricarboxylate transporter receptor subunit TctC
MEKGMRRFWIFASAIGVITILGFLNSATAVEYPTKPIEYICPFGAGSVVCLADRAIADKLSQILGKPVLVIHKPGAGGALAGLYLAKAKPDGYTIGEVNSSGQGVTLALRPDVPYKISDFEVLGQWGYNFQAMTVREDAPWKTVKDLAEYAKKNPGVLKYGSIGVGSATQLCMEVFKLAAGRLKIDHIPFKSGPEIGAAILGGHIHTGTFVWGTVKPLYEAKKVRVLAVSVPAEELPGIPTFAQEGYPEVNIKAYHGTGAPKGLPKEVSGILRDALAKTFQDPKIKEMFRNLGFTPFYRNPEAYTKYLEDQIALYKWIGKEANITLE